MYDKQSYKEWYEKTKSKRHVWQRQYYQKNRDHVLEMHKNWAKRNVDQAGSVWRKYGRWARLRNPNLDKEYYAKHREEILLKKKIYYRKKEGSMFIEKNISSSVIDEINLLLTKNIFEDKSEKTCTHEGFQTPNIVNLFNENLLKRILPIKNYYKEVFHIHYIYYLSGGYQEEHNHEKTEKYSFILYLNDSDGQTFFKKPVNKKITPKERKLIFFNSNINHGGEKSFKGKKILVGAVKKHV